MLGEKTLVVAARIERIESSVAQLRADLQRLDRKLDAHVEALRAEIRQRLDTPPAPADGGGGA